MPGNGPYRVAAVDPPWPYDAQPTEQQNSRAVRPYPTMTIEAICALAVASIMHDHSIVWLWVDNYHLLSGDALRVLAAWGFKPVTLVTWAKDRMGLGHWLRGQTEHCIMATRGKPTVFLTDESTLLFAPVGAHSEKPDAFYALVETLCPAPRYCELFARRRRPNWDAHGDEIEAAPALAGELPPVDSVLVDPRGERIVEGLEESDMRGNGNGEARSEGQAAGTVVDLFEQRARDNDDGRGAGNGGRGNGDGRGSGNGGGLGGGSDGGGDDLGPVDGRILLSASVRWPNSPAPAP